MRYLCFQREICEDTKREHWQGYVEFFDGKRVGQVSTILGGCHVEVRKGTRDEARNYCRKKNTAVHDTFVEHGFWRQDVNRKRKLSDMLLTNMSLPEIIECSPYDFVRYFRGLRALFSYRLVKRAKKFRKVIVEVFVGKTGSGKTRRAAEVPNCYFIPCSEKLWFDGYDAHPCLIIDDFYGNIKYSFLLRILDGHPLQVPTKGGFVHALWSHVIITSNREPAAWYARGMTPALERRITRIYHLQHVLQGDSFDLT